MYALVWVVIVAWIVAWAVMAWRVRVAYRRDCERNMARVLTPRPRIVLFSPYRDL